MNRKHWYRGLLCGALAPAAWLLYLGAFLYTGFTSADATLLSRWLTPVLLLLTAGVLSSVGWLIATSVHWKRDIAAGKEPQPMQKAPFSLCVLSLFLPLLFFLLIH